MTKKTKPAHGLDRAIPWCEPCGSFHPVPKDRADWRLMGCFAAAPPPSPKPLPEPGVYVLSRVVGNPYRDKRMTRDWRHDEAWKDGTRFVVQDTSSGSNREIFRFGGGGATIIRIGHRITSTGEWLRQRYDEPGPQARMDALLDALTPAPDNVGNFFGSKGYSLQSYEEAVAILAWLMDRGDTDMPTIREAWADLESMADSKERTAFNERHGL